MKYFFRLYFFSLAFFCFACAPEGVEEMEEVGQFAPTSSKADNMAKDLVFRQDFGCDVKASEVRKIFTSLYVDKVANYCNEVSDSIFKETGYRPCSDDGYCYLGGTFRGAPGKELKLKFDFSYNPQTSEVTFMVRINLSWKSKGQESGGICYHPLYVPMFKEAFDSKFALIEYQQSQACAEKNSVGTDS